MSDLALAPRPRPRRRPAPQRGQALIEFALIAPIFFGAIFFTLGALFYIAQGTSVVHATHLGGRVAAAGSGPGSASSVAALSGVQGQLEPLLRPALPGTQVTYYVDEAPPPPGTRGPCPLPASMTDAGKVAVCASIGRGVVSGTPVVLVHIYGRLASLFPGFPALRVDEQSVLHFLGFQP
jgi:hypothetical protein